MASEMISQEELVQQHQVVTHETHVRMLAALSRQLQAGTPILPTPEGYYSPSQFDAMVARVHMAAKKELAKRRTTIQKLAEERKITAARVNRMLQERSPIEDCRDLSIAHIEALRSLQCAFNDARLDIYNALVAGDQECALQAADAFILKHIEPPDQPQS